MSHPIALSSNNPYALRINTNTSAKSAPLQLVQCTLQNEQSSASKHSSKLASLRRLNGTPYPTSHKHLLMTTENMCHEQNPPEYKRTASYGHFDQSGPSVVAREPAHCGMCGGRTLADVSEIFHSVADSGCKTCGKRKMSNIEIRKSGIESQHPASLLPGRLTSTAVESSSSAVHSSVTSKRRTCYKCGKSKRPIVSDTNMVAPTAGLSIMPPPPTHHIVNQHKAYGVSQLPYPHATIGPIQRKPVPSQVSLAPDMPNLFDLNITPPSAISETIQPSPLTISSTAQHPLLQTYQPYFRDNPRRSPSISSIASSIARSLSKRARKSQECDASLPTHQLSHGTKQGTIRLLNMITTTLRRSDSQEYTRLHNSDKVEWRSTSPFSFVNKPDEESVELTDIPKSGPILDDNWDTVDIRTSDTGNPEHDPFADQKAEVQSLQSNVEWMRYEPHPVPGNTVYSQTTDNTTGLSRFKSLRSGVQRAGSVARTTSLKRFNSVKNAPQCWYRTDMAIEGATVGVY